MVWWEVFLATYTERGESTENESVATKKGRIAAALLGSNIGIISICIIISSRNWVVLTI